MGRVTGCPHSADRAASSGSKQPLLLGSVQGSKYASRLPIGLEKIIRNVPAEVVRGFYRRWYVPSNLAVVMVGDFDCDKVVQVGGQGACVLTGCTVLRAVLDCIVQYRTILHRIALNRIGLYCTVLHGISLAFHCIARYCTVLHGIARYCTVSHWHFTVLHCTHSIALAVVLSRLVLAESGGNT
jgi:hypothetical protein